MQRDALERAGCDRIFDDTGSGSVRHRPELDACLDYLLIGGRNGDDPEALVVAVDVVVRMVPAYAEGVRRHGTGRLLGVAPLRQPSVARGGGPAQMRRPVQPNRRSGDCDRRALDNPVPAAECSQHEGVAAWAQLARVAGE